MNISDLNGFAIEVTDLDEAIGQAEMFRHFRHSPPAPTDGELRRYWEDLHNKLVEIRKQHKINEDERE